MGARGALAAVLVALVVGGCAAVKISFRSDPERATITLMNEQGPIGETPRDEFKVRFRRRDEVVIAEARKDGYVSDKKNLTKKDRGRVIWFHLRVEQRKVVVFSNVSGTEIYLDSKAQGTCAPGIPLTVTVNLLDQQGNPQTYLLSASRTGWRPVERQIGPGVEYIPSEVKFQLEAEKKRILVESEPAGASVYVDGRAVKDKTPCEVVVDFVDESTSGLRQVKIEVAKPGYENPQDHSERAIEMIQYFPEEQRTVKLQLAPREEIEVPGVQIFLVPRGAVFGVRSTRAMLDPSEDSPAVASCTRLTNNQPLELEEYAERLGITSEQLREIILGGKVGELERLMPPPEDAGVTVQNFLRKYLGTISSLAISPAGKYLIFSEIEPIFPQIEKTSRGAERTSFWPERPPYKPVSDFTWGGTLPFCGEKLVFSLKAGLKAIPVTGGGTTTITDSIFIDKDPAFTADGSHIYFASTRDGDKFTLWRVRFETPSGTGITRITSSAFADHYVDLCESTDSARVVYASLGPTGRFCEEQVWTANLDGTLPTQFRYGTMPKWSPDGGKVVFCRIDNKTGWYKVWLMNQDGSEQTQVTFGESDDIWPVWSPCGQYVAYSSSAGLDGRSRHNYDIWLMKADGTTPTQLTTNGSEDVSPVWSRDGKFIYFISNRGGAWNIWRIEVGRLP